MQSHSFIGEVVQLLNSKDPFTDIRIEEGAPVAVRMPTGWVQLDDPFPPDRNAMGAVLNAIHNDWQGIIQKRALNRPLSLEGWRIRVNAYLAGGGEKIMMSMRRIPHKPPTLKDSGLPPIMRVMLTAPRGLILISGATRSGKSTSAAAMIDAINETRSAHIVTIEDPIEYVFESKKSVFSQREVGVDTDSFESGLEDALRQCPDVILVGEIRNRETAETALLAGESGHLVIGTLHANTASGAIQKMLGWFNDNERNGRLQSLSSSLLGVVNQILLPKADGKGFALACEVINNYDQEFSPILGDVAKIQNKLEGPDRKGSILMAESIADLVNSKMVATTDAVNAVMGMMSVKEKLKNLLRN